MERHSQTQCIIKCHSKRFSIMDLGACILLLPQNKIFLRIFVGLGKFYGNGGIVFRFLAFFQESPYLFALILLALYGAQSSPCSLATCFFLLLMPCSRLYTWQIPFSPLCCWSPHNFEPLHVGATQIMIHLMNTMHINNSSNNFHTNKMPWRQICINGKKVEKKWLLIINTIYFSTYVFVLSCFVHPTFFFNPKIEYIASFELLFASICPSCIISMLDAIYDTTIF